MSNPEITLSLGRLRELVNLWPVFNECGQTTSVKFTRTPGCAWADVEIDPPGGEFYILTLPDDLSKRISDEDGNELDTPHYRQGRTA